MKEIFKTVFFLFTLLFPLSATAQITRDGTTSTTVTLTETGVRIDNGNRAGGNLFHSFDEFSLPTESEAFFNNANDITNIFSRVTGGNISNIDGLIRANGTANLFLINPAGIIFGEGASLQLGGSFYGSTASSIVFPDGEFSATDLDNPPLITVNAPIGLGFRDNPAEIVNTSVGRNPNGETNIIDDPVGLQVPNGEILALIGGDVLLDDGNLTAKGGHIEIGSVRSAGEVGIIETDIGFTLDYDGIASFDDITLQNTAVVDVTASGGGSVNVTAQNITLDNSSISSGIAPDSTSNDAQAGDIVIQVTENLTLDRSYILNLVDGVGNSGKIEITTGSVEVSNGGQISSSTFIGQGNAGGITITAKGDVTFDGIDDSTEAPSGAISVVIPGAEGNSGDIKISAANLNLTNGGLVDASAFGQGNAGDVSITTNNLNLTNGATIATNTFGQGNGGNIEIDATTVSVLEGASLESNVGGFARGEAGDITIKANDVVFNGGFARSRLEAGGEGSAGDIQITTGSLLVTGIPPELISSNIGQLVTASFGQGDAGNLTIDASGDVVFDGLRSDVFSLIGGNLENPNIPPAEGNGGNITIRSSSLSIDNQARLVNTTEGVGDAGNININTDSLSISNGGSLLTQVDGIARGDAGDMTIETGTVEIGNGGRLDARTAGTGNAGNIIIKAAGSLSLAGEDNLDSESQSTITTSVGATAIGKGGELKITTPQLEIRDGAAIRADAEGQGNAGNIEIFTGDLTLSDRGQVVAGTLGKGNAGNIRIEANSIDLVNGATINAVSQSESETDDSANITLEVAEALTLRNNSLISAQALENANGGNVSINSEFIISYPSSGNGNGNDILASAEQGNGGRISITAESLLGIEERRAFDNNATNDIDASSEVDGLDGTVSIETPDNNSLRETTELSDNIVSAEIITASDICSASDIEDVSSLTIQGQDRVPHEPTAPFDGDALIIYGEPETLALPQSNGNHIDSNNIPHYVKPVAYKDNGEPIYLARGVIKQEDGTVILTAVPHQNITSRTPENPYGCGQ
ncbi:Filamentous hemagglutinin family N-terminal domain [Hyella patelloides LEGE 07179]|uniref:Filamentous hemagglutinin family N-terminal domain n=1 Tax=Hyella patelloides LEGE 07179 TaxID=945734 RepID=A0A563VSM1_9CYAN|nr:filamentous hemagglutinin N-terminal domain-containing protein [Hyella patelloides]VEP14386.1 Filamentous hemagglutinin family N-terminal domain [Hyella patelloides LEGE 07179]